MADDIVTKQSQPARKAGCDDIVTRLQEMLDGPVPFIVGREDIREAADEIDRLRNLVKLWRNAAEAYERGSLSEGDQLIDEARKGNQS